MLRTITIGSSIQVQGFLVGTATDGRMMIRVGEQVYFGVPVPRWIDRADCA